MQNTIHASLLKHNRNTPRYTSYPTAPHFMAANNADLYGSWLANIGKEESLSLYFHIPFCKKMCWYCGCHTKATKSYSPVQKYLEYVKKEVALVAQKLRPSEHKHAVKHIHFGGGSPSYLTPSDFTRLMQHIRSHFNILPSAEIAIELDPREITEAKVAAYALMGVTRASIGVQDFHAHVQKAINRYQPFHLVYENIKLLRNYGIKACNIDLLYGLPHQTDDIIAENITLAMTLLPDRISLFGYAHVPWMKKHMRLISEDILPSPEERLSQFAIASKKLKERGYKQIGLDHFVLGTDQMAISYDQHTLRRNFQGYSTDKAENLIGFGSSSIGSLAEGYVQNTPDTKEYFKRLDLGHLPIAKHIHITAEDKIRRDMINKIMCYGHFDLNDFGKTRSPEDKALTDRAFQQALAPLRLLAQDGLISLSEAACSFSVKSPQALRLAAAAFDAYLGDTSQGRHSQVA